MAYGPVSIGGYASLAPASDTQLGGIKTSDNFSISPDGVLKLSDEIFDSITRGGVVASGSNYVRFTDGTQICWGDTPAYPVIPPRTTYYVRVNFAAPFNNMAYSITADPVYDGGNTWVLHTFSLGRATSYAIIGLANGSTTDTVNAGTIYSYIAIGTWK